MATTGESRRAWRLHLVHCQTPLCERQGLNLTANAWEPAIGHQSVPEKTNEELIQRHTMIQRTTRPNKTQLPQNSGVLIDSVEESTEDLVEPIPEMISANRL